MMRRLTVTFTDMESAALDRLVEQDTRCAKDELRALLRAEAERRGLWLTAPAGSAAAGARDRGRDGEDGTRERR